MKDTTDPGRGHGPDGLTAETFFADMATTLSGTLEEFIGLEDAALFISRVGQEIGDRVAGEYRDELGALPTEPVEVGQICCDLKKRIGGAFVLEQADEARLEFSASRCPFADRALGRPSLCAMTTNVFGRIVAGSRGYAAVDVSQSIARGHDRCRVTVHLDKTDRDDLFEFFG